MVDPQQQAQQPQQANAETRIRLIMGSLMVENEGLKDVITNLQAQVAERDAAIKELYADLAKMGGKPTKPAKPK